MTDQVEVWIDADFLERTRVGTLTHDRGTLRPSSAASSTTDIETAEGIVGTLA